MRRFISRTPNGVRIQIRAALCAYLLVAIARKRHGIAQSPYILLTVRGVCHFEKTSLHQLITECELSEEGGLNHNQLEFIML